MFGKLTFELSLVKTYVAHWGLKEAARELVQNALDSSSPFVYSFEYTQQDETYTFKLNSEFAKLDAKTLLLGATSKADNVNTIGSFGEGYKIALLVLTRIGFKVTILNGDKVWEPCFRFSKKYATELLCIDETPAIDHNPTGLTFVVEGLSEEDVEAIKGVSLKMQQEIGQLKQTQYGDILLDRPGELYVGSLFVCQTEMQYGYNILPQHMRLERDRNTVDGWHLATMTRQMWYDTKEFEKVAQMIFDEVPDVEYARYDSPEIVKEACYQLFKQRNPGALIAESPKELKEMVEKGLVNTVFCGSGVYAQVYNAPNYRASNRQMVAVQLPQECLAQWLSANRSEMRAKAIEAFKKELLPAATKWTVKP